ncbi:MAG: hypothetical protein CUR34_07635 [Sediminibacterium sp.]|nr:MAG: hypothetical protein CUR34_07635 [Sediminibacterium sp.] [Sediminibacterium sp. FEMGT703S]
MKKNIGIDNILFFDLDGTLVDTNLSNYLSYKKAIKSVTNKTINQIDENQRFNRSILKKVQPNLTDSEYEKIIQLKEEYYKDFLEHTKLKQSVVNILLQYSKTNSTILVTNCRESRAVMTLDYHRLTKHFTRLIFRQINNDNLKINKYQNAILYLNISPKLVIAFEDEESEINDAKNAGIQVINPTI